MSKKNFIHNGIMISSVFVIGYFLFFAKHGVVDYYKLKNQIKKQTQKINRLNNEIHALQADIKQYQENPYETEKVARYDFGVGYTNEMVYLLKKS
jgi:cell division protein FtsB